MNKADYVPIGKGAGVVTWVVDVADEQKLVGVGCTGELLLEGPLVGAGYFGDTDRTTKSFLNPPPQWLSKGSEGVEGRKNRVNKTGDIVRYLPDGELVFIGRKDSQVKIRGQRVELGEIEYHLGAIMPETRRVVVGVVTPSDSVGATPVVVAFIENMNDSEPQAQSMQAFRMPRSTENHLRRLLPSYMIPSRLVVVHKIPLTATLKTERARLRRAFVRCGF